jgi:hypothetical protein
MRLDHCPGVGPAHPPAAQATLRAGLFPEAAAVPDWYRSLRDYIALRIDAMNLENRLSDVETDGRDRLHG